MERDGARRVGVPVWHDHVSRDAAAARDFYGAVFPWRLERSETHAAYTTIGAGGRRHGGFVTAEEGPAHWLPYLWVDGLEDALVRIEAAGGSVHTSATPIPDLGRYAIAADPAGGIFALWQDPGAGPPSREAFPWDEVYAPDPRAAARFYGDVFGWRTEPFNEVYTLLKKGEATVGGLMALPEGMQPGWLPYLAAEDVDAAATSAGARGADTILAPTDIPNVGRVAVLVDPLGALFGLFAAPGWVA